MDASASPSSGGWIPANHKRSLVWEHYLVNEQKGGSKCRHCGQFFKESSTSTLKYHLQNRHKIKVGPQPGAARASETTEPEASNRAQTQITDHFRGQGVTSEEKMLSHLAAVDGLSFHTLANSKALRQLWRGQGYKVPTCDKTIKKMVMQHSDKLQAQLKKDISSQKEKGKRFSLSMDEWTSGRNRRYAALNLHAEGTIHLLGLIRISGSMPAEKGKDLIIKKLEEFNLDLEEDILGITTDGATVMRKMGRLLPIEHQVCTQHGLHLAVTDVFYKEKENHGEESDQGSDDEDAAEVEEEEPVQVEVRNTMELNDRFAPLINRVRKISKSFRRSPLKNDLLEKKCQDHGLRPKPLLYDTKTRWNSMLAMLKRFLSLKEVIQEILVEMDSAQDFPSEEELAVLSGVVEALEIVEEGSLELSKDECDLAKADITFKFLLEELSALTSSVGRSLFKAVDKRVQERRKKTMAALLLFLRDPGGYNNMTQESVFLQYPRPSELAKDARNLYLRLFLPRQQEPVEEEEEPAAKSRKERLSDMIQGRNKTSPRGLSSSSSADQVLECMKTEMHAFASTNKRPPCLQKVYDVLMTMPPTSVSVERAFSTSSMFVSKFRCSLNDETVNNLMVLRNILKKNE